MSQPRDYTRQHDFSDYQTTNPSSPLPGTQVDAELDTLKLTLDDLNTNIGLIQRDDGKLGNLVVHKDAFDAGALALMSTGSYTPKGNWSAAAAYVVGDLVDFNSSTYLATTAHTSASAFSTDLSASRWVLLANAAISGLTFAVDKFEGNGSTTAFTLTYTYTGNEAVQVYVNGALRNPGDDYTISGTTLTFFTAPSAPAVSGNENVIAWGPPVVTQAAANAAASSSSNASGFADESESWATKVNGIVESTDYSSKAYALGGTGVDTGSGSAKDWAIKASTTVGNTGEYSAKYWATSTPVTTVAGIAGNVTTVAGIASDVTTVSGLSANVTTVAGDSADVQTVAGRTVQLGILGTTDAVADMNTLAAISGNITTVATNDANVTIVAGNNTNINTVAGNNSNVTTVAGIASDVTTVAGKASLITSDFISDLNALAVTDVISDINLLATSDIVSDLNTLATSDIVSDLNLLATSDIVGDVNLLATSDIVSDLNLLATSDFVADLNLMATSANVSDLNTVSGAISNVNTVAGISSDVTSVSGISANVTSVAGNASNINALSSALVASTTFAITVTAVGYSNYFNVDGTTNPVLSLFRGNTYTFDVSDSSNSGHPLRFRNADDSAYTTGVVVVGTPGSSGATVTLTVASDAPSALKYYCTAHGNAMGNSITVASSSLSTVAASIGNVNINAAGISNINTVAGNQTNINTTATNIADVNNFANKYRISSSAPTTSLDSGDLWWNTSANELRAYNTSSSAWAATAPTTANQASINIVAGELVYSEDLGSITAALTTGTGNSITAVGNAIASVNTVAGAVSNVNLTAGSIANVNLVGGSVASVNTVAANIADVNRYAAQYTISANAPSSPASGDLWYDSSANTLKFYTGSVFASISAGIASVAGDTSPQLGGALDAQNNNITNAGTISGSNLQLDFGGL